METETETAGTARPLGAPADRGTEELRLAIDLGIDREQLNAIARAARLSPKARGDVRAFVRDSAIAHAKRMLFARYGDAFEEEREWASIDKAEGPVTAPVRRAGRQHARLG